MTKLVIQEGTLLDNSKIYTLTEITQICVVDEKIMVEMVNYGILEPIGHEPKEWRFQGDAVLRIKKAMRLKEDLAINWPGIALALDLLAEIDELRGLLEIREEKI